MTTTKKDFFFVLSVEELAKLSIEDQQVYYAKRDRLTEQSKKSLEAFKKEIERTVVKVSYKPLDDKHPTLEQLMEGVTPENMHPEIDWGHPIGKEIW